MMPICICGSMANGSMRSSEVLISAHSACAQLQAACGSARARQYHRSWESHATTVRWAWRSAGSYWHRRGGSARIEADSALLVDGYHKFEAENGIRWTDGDAAVPAELLPGISGPCMLTLHIGAATQYIDDGSGADVADCVRRDVRSHCLRQMPVRLFPGSLTRWPIRDRKGGSLKRAARNCVGNGHDDDVGEL